VITVIPILFILIALGIILEVISLRRNPDEVEADCVLSTGFTEPGEPFTMQTIVTNKNIIPVSFIAVREILPPASKLPESIIYRTKLSGVYTRKVSRLRGYQRKKLIMETSIDKRGVHVFAGEYLDFGDFLGFREVTKVTSYEQEIVVYPKKIENQELTVALAKFTGDIAAKRHLIRDPIVTVGCREYTGREPMKEIHWLKSAGRGELVVREFDYNRQISVSVILNIEGQNFLDKEGLDECCSMARTVCETLVESGAVIKFFTNSVLEGKGNKSAWKCVVSSGHTGELLEGLGRVTAYFYNSMEKLLDYSIRESDFDSAFILIMPAEDKRGKQAIDRLRRSNGGEALLLQEVRTSEETA